jgi:hypothetical protein
MKYLKANTVTRAAETETETNSRSCVSGVYPIVEPIKRTESRTRTGCRREEKRAPPDPANDVTEKTSSRSIRAPLKPKKKNRIQRSGAPRMALIKPPRRSTPNHMREEKRERAEHRLKLKIRARLIEVRLTIKSESNVKKRKIPPKPRPTTKFSRDKFKGSIDRIPPCRDRTPR